MNLSNENRNTLNLPTPHNVSEQTFQRQWKPSIKVNYKTNSNNNPSFELSQIEVTLPSHPSHPIPKKNIETISTSPKKPSEKRHTRIQTGGRFRDSIYEKDNDHSRPSSRAMKAETYRKHHASSLFVRERGTRRSEVDTTAMSVNSSRQALPSYRDSGMKDILQYRHAKPYRPTKVTEKCNNMPVGRRQVAFEQLHQFDFRHRPQRF